MKGLDGKVAVLTGGGEGVGRSIALALAARGVRVLVTGRNERALGETVGEIAYGGGKARHLAGDARDPAHVEAAALRAIEVFGGLDIVIANEGEDARADLGTDVARAGAILTTNLVGTYHAFDAGARHMKGAGRLIAISSADHVDADGHEGLGAARGRAAFRASRAGILGLVRAAALELAPRGITSNAVLAGPVDAGASEERLAAFAAEQGKTKAEVLAAVPPGRLLAPEEVADLVVWLCSPAADGITGQSIAIGAGAYASTR